MPPNKWLIGANQWPYKHDILININIEVTHCANVTVPEQLESVRHCRCKSTSNVACPYWETLQAIELSVVRQWCPSTDTSHIEKAIKMPLLRW